MITLAQLQEIQGQVLGADEDGSGKWLERLKSSQPAVYDHAMAVATEAPDEQSPGGGPVGADFMAVVLVLTEAYQKAHKVRPIEEDAVRLVAGLLNESANKPELTMPRPELTQFLKSGLGWTIREGAVADYLVDVFYEGYSDEVKDMMMVNLVAVAMSLQAAAK